MERLNESGKKDKATRRVKDIRRLQEWGKKDTVKRRVKNRMAKDPGKKRGQEKSKRWRG